MRLEATRSAVTGTFVHASLQLDLEPRYLPTTGRNEDEREKHAQH